MSDLSFHVMKAGNCKTGRTRPSEKHPNGNPYINVGCVVKSGPEKDKWYNFFLVITEKTKERVKKYLRVMGVTDTEPFATDGRMFSGGVVAFDEFSKGPRLVHVSDLKKGASASEDSDEHNPF